MESGNLLTGDSDFITFRRPTEWAKKHFAERMHRKIQPNGSDHIPRSSRESWWKRNSEKELSFKQAFSTGTDGNILVRKKPCACSRKPLSLQGIKAKSLEFVINSDEYLDLYFYGTWILPQRILLAKKILCTTLRYATWMYCTLPQKASIFARDKIHAYKCKG